MLSSLSIHYADHATLFSHTVIPLVRHWGQRDFFLRFRFLESASTRLLCQENKILHFWSLMNWIVYKDWLKNIHQTTQINYVRLYYRWGKAQFKWTVVRFLNLMEKIWSMVRSDCHIWVQTNRVGTALWFSSKRLTCDNASSQTKGTQNCCCIRHCTSLHMPGIIGIIWQLWDRRISKVIILQQSPWGHLLLV